MRREERGERRERERERERERGRESQLYQIYESNDNNFWTQTCPKLPNGLGIIVTANIIISNMSYNITHSNYVKI